MTKDCQDLRKLALAGTGVEVEEDLNSASKYEAENLEPEIKMEVETEPKAAAPDPEPETLPNDYQIQPPKDPTKYRNHLSIFNSKSEKTWQSELSIIKLLNFSMKKHIIFEDSMKVLGNGYKEVTKMLYILELFLQGKRTEGKSNRSEEQEWYGLGDNFRDQVQDRIDSFNMYIKTPAGKIILADAKNSENSTRCPLTRHKSARSARSSRTCMESDPFPVEYQLENSSIQKVTQTWIKTFKNLKHEYEFFYKIATFYNRFFYDLFMQSLIYFSAHNCFKNEKEAFIMHMNVPLPEFELDEGLIEYLKEVQTGQISFKGIVERNANTESNHKCASNDVSKETKETNEPPICLICHEPYTINTKIIKLKCHHIFHKNCIAPWFKKKIKNKSCPYCRKDSFQVSEAHYSRLLEDGTISKIFGSVDKAMQFPNIDKKHNYDFNTIKDKSTNSIFLNDNLIKDLKFTQKIEGHEKSLINNFFKTLDNNRWAYGGTRELCEHKMMDIWFECVEKLYVEI